MQFDVLYKDKVVGAQRLDILVDGQVVVELKSLTKLPEVATAQTLSQLRATGRNRALLINFGELRLVDGVTRISL